ncbi:MAG: UvrD-helicase domain-containing protein, partial [Bacteroidota bacterium]
MDDLLQKQQKNTTGKFKIYRSSAGSGKTFTLTKEYLKLALATPGNENFSPFYFRHILAVTFTNDAAKEMKERILGNLSSIAHLPEGEKYDMLNLILEELQEEYPQLKLDADELKRRAALLHETILHRYTDFSVSTIDAFSNRVVQSFKKDLNLPYNYDIVLEVDELLEEAADLLQDQIGTEEGKEISNLLVEFALNKAEEESSWYIDEALKEFGKQLFIEDRLAHIESISELMPASFKQIISKIYQYLKKVDSDLIGLGRSALDLIKANSIRPEAFARGKQGIAGFFAKAASSSAILSELNLSNSYILKTIEDDKWTSGKADAAEKAAIESIKGTLMALYYRIVALAEAEKGNYIIINSLKKNIYLIATINELGRKVSEIKAEKHQVHIADFNQKINQIVEEEPVPYIYERLGDRYKHILIDEFQDTSRMQWHNLIPLVLNALGLNMANLVVGDAKQAIYRWRGGKADMLVSLPDIPTAPPESVIAQEAVAFKLHQQALSLSTNRRSKDDIINFNNLFFETLKTRFSLQYPSLKDFYEDVEQACNNKPGGLIKLEFIQSGIARSLFEAATFNRVLTQINELVASGIYQHADIAILVRNNRAGAFLAEKLMEHNIHVVSDESLLLHNSPIIKFITGFLSVIAFPVNPVLKMELIEFLDQHYQKIIPGGKVLNGIVYNQLGEILKQHDLFQFFEWLNEFFGATLQVRGIQFRTLYEMTEELIRQFQLYYEVPQQVYLQKFLDIVLSF